MNGSMAIFYFDENQSADFSASWACSAPMAR
jgi:hypothetical protein